MGINYREGLLHYGKIAEYGYINRFLIFKALLIINLFIFIISLIVVVIMGGRHHKEVVSLKEEGSSYRPRSSGY